MNPTDYFGRSVSDNDIIWVPAQVVSFSDGIFVLNYENTDGSIATLSATAGSSGQTTNPAEGDRPPH